VVVVRSVYIFAGSHIQPPVPPVAKAPTPDYARDLGKLEGGVDVLKNLTFTVIGFLFAIGGGGIFLLTQINDVKSNLEATKVTVATALQKITNVENTIGELRSGQGSVTGSLSRIEAALRGQQSPSPQTIATQLLISIDDAQTIRAALKLDPEQVYKGVGKLGDILTDAKLLDFPTELVAKFPQLKSMRYTFDSKGQILIAAADQRVIAVV
jgi:hypothetical protein